MVLSVLRLACLLRTEYCVPLYRTDHVPVISPVLRTVIQFVGGADNLREAMESINTSNYHFRFAISQIGDVGFRVLAASPLFTT